MRAVDLHPEELLERDARAELTTAESERLHAHLQVCAVCRFERLARQDVGTEIDRAEGVDVQRLLATVLTPETLRRPAAPVLPARRRGPRTRVVLLAAAMVTIAGVAGAAGYTELRERVSGHRQATDTVVESAPSPRATPTTKALLTRGSVVPSEAPQELAAAVASEAPAPLEPSTSTLASTGPSALITPPRPPALRVAVAEARGLETSGSLAPWTATPPLGAPALFDRANAARHAGNGQDAIDRYRALIVQYPASAEAHEALAALGKMLLDRGDASGAMQNFDDYLRGGGPLRQDVMADRASALQHLGRTAEEARAWTALLASYPASVHAERARRRLAELETP